MKKFLFLVPKNYFLSLTFWAGWLSVGCTERAIKNSLFMGSTSNSAENMGRVVKLTRHGGLFQSNPRLC